MVTVAAEVTSVGAPGSCVKSMSASPAQLTTGVTAPAGRIALVTDTPPAPAARAGAGDGPASWKTSSRSPAKAMRMVVNMTG